MLCKYKDIFGEVGKGLHKYRLFNLAIVDVLFTILGSYIIYRYKKNYNFFYILFVVFLIGIIVHRIFCVRTTIDKLLFK